MFSASSRALQLMATILELGGTVKAEVKLSGSPTAPLVVLVPGVAGRGPDDFDNLAESLQPDFRTCAVCPRGLRRSVSPAEPCLDDFADDTAGVVRALSPDRPAVLVGWCYGARIVRAVAHAYPDLVAGLVLIGCGGEAPPGELALRAHRASFLPYIPDLFRARLIARAFFAPSPGVDAPELRRLGWGPGQGWDVSFDRFMMAAMARPTRCGREWLDGGKARMLVVQGLDDEIADLRNAKALLERLGPSRCRLEVLSRCAHALLPERPDAIALIVRSFLTSPAVARLLEGGGEGQGKLCATDEHAWGGGGTCEMPGTRGTLWL